MTAPAAQGQAATLLDIEELNKSFGGVQAIRDLHLSVDEGEILGVIGPNGSGKTTLFNVISGVTEADHGTLAWGAERQNLIGEKPWNIFALGIARTFQNIRLSMGLSVLENVMVGLYLSTKSTWVDVLLKSPRLVKRESEAREEAYEAVKLVDDNLAENADKLVAELSYPDRRRVEIARAIVSRPRLLLLDEPTAGMNVAETDELSDDVRKVNSTGVSIILVEHKMKFVSDLAARVAVLNFGQKIAEGTYDEIRADEAVVEAYLGRRRDE